MKAGFSLVVVLVFLAGILFIATNDGINWLFNRPVQITWENLLYKDWAVFTLSPAGGGFIWFKLFLATLGVCNLIGAVVLWRNKYTRWILVSWLLVFLLVLGTLVPLPVITKLTAIWYYGLYRVMPILAIPTIIMITAGVNAVYRYLLKICHKLEEAENEPGYYKLGVVMLVVSTMLTSGIISWIPRAYQARELYKPVRSENVFMADNEELQMVFRSAEKLTDDRLVLGEASTGASLIYIVTGHPVVYKQVTFGSIENGNPDSVYLAHKFEDYKTDSKICQPVNQYNIGYFYADRRYQFNHKEQKDRASGLFGVILDPADFELLDKGGTAELYRFTGCEPEKGRCHLPL